MSGLMTVFWKELADHFSSKRFIILLFLIYLAGLSAVYVATQTIRSEVTGTTEMVFLKLFTTSGGVLPPFLLFIIFFIPIVGVALGFDSINSERSSGTLSRILSQPLFRDAVINGKFLAGLVTMGIMLVSIVTIIGGMGLRIIGVPPSSEEVWRILIFLGVCITYGAFWMSLAVLFSILFERTATSALAAIAIWIFFAFFMPMIAGLIADAIVPLSQSEAQSNPALIVKREEIEGMILRISPTTLFGEATVTILVPTVRTLGPVLVTEATRMIPNPLPLRESLLIVWPHLTSLIALTAICFAISYVKFMRQEIRAT
jgi:ABC-2 type transport system permease protein